MRRRTDRAQLSHNPPEAAASAELRRESAELVAGISRGERIAVRHPVAHRAHPPVRRASLQRAEMPGEILVQLNETGAQQRSRPEAAK